MLELVWDSLTINSKSDDAMPIQKPKKPPEHDHNSIAIFNLKSIFGNWNIYDGNNINGIEYGRDWTAEIVEEDGSVTGMLFFGQSKVLSSESLLTEDSIRTSIAISVLSYLNELPAPVMLHFFDKITGVGYYMWLKPWYVANFSEKWHHQKTTRVTIPRSNLLDVTAKKSIELHVKAYYASRKHRDLVDYVNQSFNDYSLELQSKDQSDTIVVRAKNEAAMPIVTPLDKEAYESYTSAIETGARTEISGRFKIENLPEPILEAISGLGRVEFVPSLNNAPPLHLKITFASKENVTLFEDHFVKLQPVQFGGNIKKWQGQVPGQAIVYSLVLNSEDKRFSFNFSLDNAVGNPKALQRIINLLDVIDDITNFTVFDLERNVSIVDSVPAGFNIVTTGISPEFVRLVNALAFVLERSGTLINVPDSFTDYDLHNAERLATILKRGFWHELVNVPEDWDKVITLGGDREAIVEAFRFFDSESDEVKTYTQPNIYSNVIYPIWGETIDLGPCDYVFEDLELINREEILSNLEDSNQLGDCKLVLKCKPNSAFTYFPKWQTNT